MNDLQTAPTKTSFARSPDGTRIAYDREFLRHFNVPAMLGWVRAMLDWPAVEPVDFRRPTLWLVGSEDRHAMVSRETYAAVLPGSRVQVQVITRPSTRSTGLCRLCWRLSDHDSEHRPLVP